MLSCKPVSSSPGEHLLGKWLMAAAAKLLQSCPTLCDPMDCSLPDFSVHGVLQAGTLEWVAISFSWIAIIIFLAQKCTFKRLESLMTSL